MGTAKFVAAFMATLLVAACGGSSSPAASSSPSPAASSSSGPVAPLNIVIGSATVSYGSVFVALANNLFAKNGVHVNVVDYTGVATGAQQLVAGQIDLSGVVNQALSIAEQGKQTSIISDIANLSGRGYAFLGRPGITSMSQLQSMGTNCTIISLVSGTPLYAYTQKVMKAYNLHCRLITTSAANLSATTVESGGADAGTVVPIDGTTAQANGKGNLLLNPTKMSDADAAKIFPIVYPILTWVGLKDNLQAKRESVIRFERALRQASALMAKTSPDQLAQWCLNNLPLNPFAGSTQTALSAAWTLQLAQFPKGSDAGFISEATWNAELTGIAQDWHLANFDPTAPAVQYKSIVDMSYFNAAK